MTRRNKAKGKYKRDSSEANLTKYKHLRNKFYKVCKDAQRSHIYQSLDVGDSGKVWRFLETVGVGRQAKDTYKTFYKYYACIGSRATFSNNTILFAMHKII